MPKKWLVIELHIEMTDDTTGNDTEDLIGVIEGVVAAHPNTLNMYYEEMES